MEPFTKLVSYFAMSMSVIWIRNVFWTLKNIFDKDFLLLLADIPNIMTSLWHHGIPDITTFTESAIKYFTMNWVRDLYQINSSYCRLSEVNELTLDVVELLPFKHGSVRNTDLIKSILRSILISVDRPTLTSYA